MLTCTGEIVKFKSGKHVKTSSIATDEHVKEIFLQQQLREMKVEDWTQETSKINCSYSSGAYIRISIFLSLSITA
jgi:predicted ATP-dependent protease